MWSVVESKRTEDELSTASVSSSSSDSSSESDITDTDDRAFSLLKKNRGVEPLLLSTLRLYLCLPSRLMHVRGKRPIEREGEIVVFKLRCGKPLTASYKAVEMPRASAYRRCTVCFSSLSSCTDVFEDEAE